MKIEIKNYTKVIKGKKILDNINYVFEGGNIYGLHGRNGSGKTMMMRAIAGLIYPTEGEIIIDEKVLHKDISFPSDMGIVIENMELMPQFDGFTNLKQLSKIRKKASDGDIMEALQKVGLGNAEKKKVRAYSLGMKQKLSIAQAIFEKNKILLLDEPTNALDEKSIGDVRKLLVELKNEGTLIIIASHNREDISYLSDVKLEMDEGKIVKEVKCVGTIGKNIL